MAAKQRAAMGDRRWSGAAGEEFSGFPGREKRF